MFHYEARVFAWRCSMTISRQTFFVFILKNKGADMFDTRICVDLHDEDHTSQHCWSSPSDVHTYVHRAAPAVGSRRNVGIQRILTGSRSRPLGGAHALTAPATLRSCLHAELRNTCGLLARCRDTTPRRRVVPDVSRETCGTPPWFFMPITI